MSDIKDHIEDSLRNALRKASAEGYKRGMEVALARVEGCRMTGASPIGPLHGAGWNAAIKHAADALRDLVPPE